MAWQFWKQHLIFLNEGDIGLHALSRLTTKGTKLTKIEIVMSSKGIIKYHQGNMWGSQTEFPQHPELGKHTQGWVILSEHQDTVMYNTIERILDHDLPTNN